MEELGRRISRVLRRERERAGLTAAELARRAGVSKATVSQLESGTANPSVETLWAVATALGVPFSVFVDEPDDTPTLIRSGAADGIRAADATYEAVLLAAGAPHARSDLYLLRVEPDEPRSSLPHTVGTVEHVVLISGSALVGPADAPIELAPGDYLRYRGDAPHVFAALSAGTRAVLVSEVR
ncbi:MAG: DNA-binding protein [Microbacterium sp. 69-7]|uniref:helix-turn-helix domain-containing protein n=1 Tax=Microbacterium sp. 69-7 TaxID=1895784 RepID=UPI00025887AA|nr:XRE family transcriptional regulator [Microbacterium sp. 69-7]EIC06839.1 helix-turn-helix domain protein [Microbacterium laevaniformans OR221]OJU44712.1 MAG: DNA-binding protein [Microbacterium sp. 69-7]